MFYIMDKETEITIAMTAYEDAANEIAKHFGNAIIRFVKGNGDKTVQSFAEAKSEMKEILNERR